MVEAEIWGNKLRFDTDPALFSPLSADRGTLAMLGTVELKPEDKVLDLGCGYGMVGIAAARVIGPERVFMVDINEKAVGLSARNAALNGVPGVNVKQGDGVHAFAETDFTLILSNPPYHTDFSVAKSFIEEGFRHLETGGAMVMVVKRLDWYKNKMTTVFGGVKVREDAGYYVLSSEKRAGTSPKQQKNQTTRKHEKRLRQSKSRKGRET